VIERWLAELARELRVHGRRRRRILEELADHMHECAASRGEADAVARMGDPITVARSFTPRLIDRAFEQRDRLGALTMLAAMAACLPLAWTLQHLGREADSYAWAWFLAFLAPTAAVALGSCVAVLRRRRLGARLAVPLAAMVAATALVVMLDLPPAQAEFREYRLDQRGLAATGTLAGCDRDPSCVIAADHASEIRINYSLGALVLSMVYVWAVAGWTPRRRRRSQNALA
jgi:hypothetical protein